MTVAPIRGSGRPLNGYFAADGEKVIGTTSVTGRFGDKNGIIAKAKMLWHEAGAKGEPFDREKFWGDALTVGSFAHLAIEAYIYGDPALVIPAEFQGRVASSLTAWKNWFEETRLELVATELPLVSEKYRYGGTLDAVARDVKGRLALLDWKTSKGIYEDYLWQVAAYGNLWDETQKEPLTGGFRIVRISKESGDLEFRHFPDLSDAWETFKHLLAAYELTKSVKRRAA